MMARLIEEHTFTSVDGAEIFYRYWPSQKQANNKRAIILFHLGHEHSGRLQDAVDGLNMPRATIALLEMRVS